MRKLALFLPLLASGCLSTATAVVKAPFQVAGKAIDVATTSQAEADRNYGRKMRKAEAREGMERRAWAKACDGHAEREGCDQYRGYLASSAR